MGGDRNLINKNPSLDRTTKNLFSLSTTDVVEKECKILTWWTPGEHSIH